MPIDPIIVNPLFRHHRFCEFYRRLYYMANNKTCDLGEPNDLLVSLAITLIDLPQDEYEYLLRMIIRPVNREDT